MQRHYQVILEAFLSILIIIDLLFLGLITVGFIGGIKPGSVYLVSEFDLLIAFLIFLDFIVFRVIKRKNENVTSFLQDNWAYILAIIPLTYISFNILHLFSYIVLIGVLGLIRIYALVNVLRITTKNVREYPSKTKLDYATFIILLILIVGSYLFYIVEHGVNPEVNNFESAMWYSIVSMTTTGYGDVVPVTLMGRIIGVIIIFSGMGYVSLVTATLAYSFIDLFRKESRKASKKLQESASQYNENMDVLLNRIDKLEKKIDDMKKNPPE